MIHEAVNVVHRLVRRARVEWGSFAFVPLLTPAYLILLFAFGGQVRPEHWVISVLVLVVGYAGARGASFLRDVYPWLLVITTYDAFRYVRSAWAPGNAIFSCSVRDLELQAFSVAPGVTLTDWLVRHHRLGLDLFFAVPYAVFVYLALGYAAYLYFHDRVRMRRFLWSFAIANFVSYSIWLFFPVAPPWYVRAHGCGIDFSVAPSEAAALGRVDALLGVGYFHAFYSRAASVFGAVPSMHAAYPMLGLLTAWNRVGWKTRPLHLFYVSWMAAAAVYLDHHWLVDVLAGWSVAGLAVVATGYRAVRVPGTRALLPVLTLGLVVLALVLLRSQLPAAVSGATHARPVVLLVLVLFLVWNHVATLAWRILIEATGARSSPLLALARLRIEAQAINQLVPAAGFAGEVVRAVRAAEPESLGPTALATALDNLAGTIAGLGFAIPVGFAVLFFRARALPNDMSERLTIVALALALLVLVVALSIQLAPRVLARLSSEQRLPGWLAIVDVRSWAVKKAFAGALLLRFFERLIAIGETYVVFRAVGASISMVDAAFVSAVLVVVSFTVFFVPGQLGASEAAVAATSAVIGLPAAVGLSAALLRRARQLFVCVVGVVFLLVRKHTSARLDSTKEIEEVR